MLFYGVILTESSKIIMLLHQYCNASNKHPGTIFEDPRWALIWEGEGG